MSDPHLDAATRLVTAAMRPGAARAVVHGFFDDATSTISYVVADPATGKAAIIDSVRDFDPASGRTATRSAERLAEYVETQNLQVEWLLETHIHADHLSAAPYLRDRLGGKLAIGRHITAVQQTFGEIFNAGADFARDGAQFDHLFDDGEPFTLGALPAIALHVPGHTPADMAYAIGGHVFVGDTLFMPDYGTARADFPGGDARTLYRSIRRLLALPPATPLFLCHDYLAPGRDAHIWETTVAAQRQGNVHVNDSVGEADFVARREARDATLAMPRLILPSIQVNMRGGYFPPAEGNGVVYLKLPVDRL